MANFRFLDVLIEIADSEFFIILYRKPTFSGQYTRWHYFGPKIEDKLY